MKGKREEDKGMKGVKERKYNRNSPLNVNGPLPLDMNKNEANNAVGKPISVR
jgi:hypothetical protein